MDILTKGRIARIEDHGTIVVAWLNDEGTESPVYFDHRQFQNLVDSYGETLTEEEFVYNGEVIWTTVGVAEKGESV